MADILHTALILLFATSFYNILKTDKPDISTQLAINFRLIKGKTLNK